MPECGAIAATGPPERETGGMEDEDEEEEEGAEDVGGRGKSSGLV